jgi:putative transposase
MEFDLFRRRHLPHWDVPGAAYFVTACLDGSIPARGLLDIAEFTEQLRHRFQPAQLAKEEWEARLWKLAFARVDSWLDKDPANRALADPQLAKTVVDAMYHFAGVRYTLLAYVVMPSHLHWLFLPLSPWIQQFDDANRTPREKIMYSLKRFTANACNRLLNRRGTFWQAESYDHWVRSHQEMERIIYYIEDNPVKAGLVQNPEDWPFSSAIDRKMAGLQWGEPLCRPGSAS